MKNSEVISRIKFISKIKKEEKINTRYIFVQSAGIVTSLSRTFFYQDNRGNAFNFCKKSIDEAFELLENLEKSNDKLAYEKLFQDLEKACGGLLNLKHTYIRDTKFCCDMDMLIDDIAVKLVKNKKEKIL